MAIIDRYNDALNHIPPPGCGCHPFLLSVANYGVFTELPAEIIFSDIRQAIPHGSRQVADREITDAINKALQDHSGGTFIPKPRPTPVVENSTEARQRIISQAKTSDEADLWESSPLRLWNEPQKDPVLFLNSMFRPDELVWVGERNQAGIIGDTIRTASQWIEHFRNGGSTAPHIIINPLSGTPAPTKSGDKNTFRGDGNIKTFRYCMAEFDNLSRGDQIRFWSTIKLPIVALIDSGGKSIHGWLDISKLTAVDTPERWQSEIKGRLYDRILTPLGVDGACSNPARLSRLPGHLRGERRQKILWLKGNF